MKGINIFLNSLVVAVLISYVIEAITTFDLWRRFVLYIHIKTGKLLFQYMMIYTPANSDAPASKQIVKGILFSNDKDYLNKVVEVE